MWDLPRPGLEPVSLALAGGFLTTAPPGKPGPVLLIGHVFVCSFCRWDECWEPSKYGISPLREGLKWDLIGLPYFGTSTWLVTCVLIIKCIKKLSIFVSNAFRLFEIKRYTMVNSEISIPPLSTSHPNLLVTTIMLYFDIFFQTVLYIYIFNCIFFSPPSKYGTAYTSVPCLFYLLKCLQDWSFHICVFVYQEYHFFQELHLLLGTSIKTYCWSISFPLQIVLQCVFIILVYFAQLPLLSCVNLCCY